MVTFSPKRLIFEKSVNMQSDRAGSIGLRVGPLKIGPRNPLNTCLNMLLFLASAFIGICLEKSLIWPPKWALDGLV